MKRRASAYKGSSTTNHTIPISIATFFIGVIATFMITTVLAQTTDTNQIYGCVNNTNGNLRVVTSTDPCKQQEKSIKWSIQGPPGPRGPAGSIGGLNQYFGLPFICNHCLLSNFASRFAGKDFSYAQIIASDFSNSDLTGVVFKHAFLSLDSFTDSNLTDADLSDIQVLPSGSLPENNVFNGANVTGANFSNSVLHEAQFKNANLQNANFSNTTLTRVKFTGAQNMGSANFSGAAFDEVTCPDGTNSDNNGSSCDGHF